jgi:hypothetical protein
MVGSGVRGPARRFWRADAVKDVTAQRMTFFDPGVVEIAAGVAGHSQAFHHALRPDVWYGGHCDHLVPTQPVEGEAERGPRTFGRITASPTFWCKPPPDLTRRREMRRERNLLQGHDSSEGRLANLDHPPSVATTLEVRA